AGEPGTSAGAGSAWTRAPGTLRAAASEDGRSALAVAFASEQIGKRYCWGGTGPSCFDCSGLVPAARRAAGLRLPRTSDAQARAAVLRVVDDGSDGSFDLAALRRGDILW